MHHHLHEIFSSIQGEGRNAGRSATFVRYASCNLACPWCDTHKTEHMALSTSHVLEKVRTRGNRFVVITGGEPTVQPGLYDLARALKADGRYVALETNGLRALEDPDAFDYVAVSPKALYAIRYKASDILVKADEVRIVAEKEKILDFCREMRGRIAAHDYYISPLDDGKRIHYRRAFDVLTELNKDANLDPPWALSLQIHKVLGLR